MSSVVLSGDSSGTVTLTVPSAAGTNTATLPAATGTVMVSGNQPAFCATMTANQSINNATSTLIQFNSVSGGNGFDTASAFNTSTYKFTPQVAGYYLVTGNLQGPASSTGSLQVLLYKNGSIWGNINSVQNVSIGAVVCGSAIVYLNGSTDYIQLYGYQTTGGAANIYSGSTNGSYFQASLIRGA